MAYRVTLKQPDTFPAEQRIRAGILVLKDGGYEGDLSKEQLEAIKADSYLVVEEVKAPKPVTPKKKPSI